MPTIQIDLDTKTFNRLAQIAVEERRPIPWQAEVLLLTAIGRWPDRLLDVLKPHESPVTDGEQEEF
jgi:hypothetical protein